MRPTVLGVALAGGLLGELLLDDKIIIHGGRLVVNYELMPQGRGKAVRWLEPERPTDQLSADIYDAVSCDQQQTLQAWLAVLAEVSVAHTTLRLQRIGQLTPTAVRRASRLRPWAAAPTHVVVGGTGDEVWAVLSTRLIRGDPRPERERLADALVVGIATVTGLLDHLLEGARPVAFARARRLVASLPEPLSLLVAQIDAAIARGALAPGG